MVKLQNWPWVFLKSGWFAKRKKKKKVTINLLSLIERGGLKYINLQDDDDDTIVCAPQECIQCLSFF